MSPKRGEIWSLDDGRAVLVLSSTFYNEIASEPTIVVAWCLCSQVSRMPASGSLGGDTWAAPGFITSLRKTRLSEYRSRVDVQVLTNVNNMLFRILATPDR